MKQEHKIDFIAKIGEFVGKSCVMDSRRLFYSSFSSLVEFFDVMTTKGRERALRLSHSVCRERSIHFISSSFRLLFLNEDEALSVL